MLNKNNLLKNDKVVSKILDMAFIYKGIITSEIKKEFFNLLKQEKFISDKVNKISVYVYIEGYNGNFRDGFRLFGFSLLIIEYYSTRTGSNYLQISKDEIERWLGYEID